MSWLARLRGRATRPVSRYLPTDQATTEQIARIFADEIRKAGERDR